MDFSGGFGEQSLVSPGHSVGKVAITGATIVSGRPDSKLRSIGVVPGERNKGTNGINVPSIPLKQRVFRFGNKGLLIVRSWMAKKNSGDGDSGVTISLSTRILRAYFRKRAHSVIVGGLLEDFRIEPSKREKNCCWHTHSVFIFVPKADRKRPEQWEQVLLFRP